MARILTRARAIMFSSKPKFDANKAKVQLKMLINRCARPVRRARPPRPARRLSYFLLVDGGVRLAAG